MKPDAIKLLDSAVQFCLTFIALVVSLSLPLILTVKIRIEEKFHSEIISNMLGQDVWIQCFYWSGGLSVIPTVLYFSNFSAPSDLLEYSSYWLLFGFTFCFFLVGAGTIISLHKFLNTKQLFRSIVNNSEFMPLITLFAKAARENDDPELMKMIINEIKDRAATDRANGMDFFLIFHREAQWVFREVMEERKAIYYFHSLTVCGNIINSKPDSEFNTGEWIYLWNILWICIEKDLDDEILTIWDQLHAKYQQFQFGLDEKRRWKVRTRFVKFGIMLLALLWKKERYSAVKRILKYTLSSVRQHELLPNFQSEIFQILIDLTNDNQIDEFIVNLRFPEGDGLNWLNSRVDVEVFLQIYLFHMYELFPAGYMMDRFNYQYFMPKSDSDRNYLILFIERALNKFNQGEHLKIIDQFYFTKKNYTQLNIEAPDVLFPKMVKYFRGLTLH